MRRTGEFLLTKEETVEILQENEIVIEIRQFTQDEYKADLRKELENGGLYKAIEKRCDEINDVCGCMRYVSHRYVQELLVEILDLLEEDES